MDEYGTRESIVRLSRVRRSSPEYAKTYINAVREELQLTQAKRQVKPKSTPEDLTVSLNALKAWLSADHSQLSEFDYLQQKLQHEGLLPEEKLRFSRLAGTGWYG